MVGYICIEKGLGELRSTNNAPSAQEHGHSQPSAATDTLFAGYRIEEIGHRTGMILPTLWLLQA